MVKITRGSSDNLIIAFPCHPTYIKQIKSLKGSFWHPNGKYWSIPYSDFVIDKIISIFKSENIDLDPSLKASNFEDLKRELTFRKYSPKTIKAYLYYNKNFLESAKKTSQQIRENDIKNYLFHLANERKVSTSILNGAINALKFYYGTILKKKFIYEVKRPRKDKKLPVVLNNNEVSKILSSPSNIKHKAILMLVYPVRNYFEAKNLTYLLLFLRA